MGCFAGDPILVPSNRDSRGIWGSQPLRMWWLKRRWEGLATTSTCILEDWIHTCIVQVVIQTSSFTYYLQNRVTSTLSKRSSARCRSAWFRSSNEFWRGLEPSLHTPRQEDESHPTHCGHYNPAQFYLKGWQQCLEAVLPTGAQDPLGKPRGKQKEVTVPRAKPILDMNHFLIHTAWVLILSKYRR